jgi:hypothetical protein
MVLVLFDEFLFNQKYYGNHASAEELERWKFIFNGVINSKVAVRVSKFFKKII